MPLNTSLPSLISVSISINEGDPYWTCELTVAEPADFIQFHPNDKFVFTLDGEEYHFYVTSAGLDRSGPAEMRGTVRGTGLGIDLDFPRSKTISKVWEEETLASVVVQELLKGRVQLWDLVDWPIPKFRFGLENSSRVSSAVQVVEAAGGVLEGTPDGGFIVRHLWPISPWDQNAASAVHTFDENDSLLSVSFDYTLTRYVDSVHVIDIDVSYQDKTEVIDDEVDPLKKTIKVYPSPWRSDWTLKHTGPADIDLTFVAISERTETELVEILNGQGRTKYPIKDSLTWKWKARNLTALYHEPYSDVLYSVNATEKYSLVEVTYKVSCYEYTTTSPIPDDVQFLIENNP